MAGTAAALWLGLSTVAVFAQQASTTPATAEELAAAKKKGTAAGTTELKAVEVTAAAPAAGSTSPAVTSKEGTALLTTTTASQITNKMIQSWDDFAKRAEPGVNFSDKNKSINVRGLDQNNVLTTIDGIRVPYMGAGSARTGDGGGLSTFDFNALSTVDVVRGADSSVVGSGAMGGLVALTTLTADDVITEGRNFGLLTKNGYASANNSWFTSNAVAGRFKDTSILVQGSYSEGHETETQGDIGGYGPRRTEANPMDFDQYSLLGKLTQSFDGGHKLTLAGETFKYDSSTDAMTAQSLTGNYRPGDNTTGELAERQRVSLTYDFHAEEAGNWPDNAQIIGYWQNVKTEADTDAYRTTSVIGPYVRQNSNELAEYGAKGFADKTVGLFGYQNKFTVGGELFLTEASQYSFGIDNCPPNPAPMSTCSMLHSDQADSPDADGTTVGLYVRDDIAINDKFTLTPGLRYDWYQQTPQATEGFEQNAVFLGLPEESSGSKFSPSLLGTYKVNNDLSVYAQWAQAFTAPTAAQLYLTYGGPGAYAALGNPDLEPQEASGYEVGLKYGDEKLGAGLALFNNYYKNFISDRDLSDAEQIARGYDPDDYPLGITEYINVPSARIYGMEARGNWEFAEGWRTWGSLAWVVGQNTATNQWLENIPPVKGVVGLGYATSEWGTDVLVTAAAVNAQTLQAQTPVAATSPITGSGSPAGPGFRAPAYAVVDWTVWWAPSQVKGLRIQGGVFNLFDATYYNGLDVPTSITNASTNLEYYSEPGRNYRVNLTYQF
jgi:hemoglobin/transferrin/lactoferrin receptor protein